MNRRNDRVPRRSQAPRRRAVSKDSFRDDPMYSSIVRVVAAILAGGNVVTSVDVLVRIGWLAPEDLEAWRSGRVPYLERAIRCNLTRLSRFLRILGFHCHDLNLTASDTAYVKWGQGRRTPLRFTKTGDAALERVYGRHFVWPGKGPFHLPLPPEERENDDEHSRTPAFLILAKGPEATMTNRKATATKPTKPKKKSSGGAASVPPPLVFEGALAGLFAGGGRARGKRSAKADALYEAQQIMYSAWESPDPKRRVALAQQALEISPDCADAYSLLAAHTRDLAEATRLNGLAVEAGMNALGPKAFEEDVGHFWGLLETRPYMRARLALAQCLWESGDRDDAIEHYRDMLRLNPGDNQGIRYILASCLLETGRDAEVVALLDAYTDEASAAWTWSRALLAFRKHGDDEQAKAALAEAKRTNPHVPAYLTGKKKLPKHLPDMIGFGDESEAISYVGDYGSAWKNSHRMGGILMSVDNEGMKGAAS